MIINASTLALSILLYVVTSGVLYGSYSDLSALHSSYYLKKSLGFVLQQADSEKKQ